MESINSAEVERKLEYLAIEAFKSSGFLIVNKTLIKELGLIPTILLSNYIDKHIYFKEKFPELEGWFFLTHEQQKEQLNVAEHSIIKSKQFLIDKKIIQSQKRGIPAKEFLHIDFKVLIKMLTDTILVPPKTGGLDPANSGGLYKDNKNKEKNSVFSEKNEKNIIPPSIKMVTLYCRERNNSVNPRTFIDFYSSKGWLVGKAKMKDWQAAVRTWESHDQSPPLNKPDIYDDGIHYVWDPKIKQYVHNKTRQIYIP